MSPARVHVVESPQNPTFRRLKKLLAPRGVHKEGQAILSGRRLVGEALSAIPERAVAWITPGEGEPPPAPSLTWYRLAPALFRELDVSGTHAPLLLVSVPEIPPWRPEQGLPEGASLLVPFQDPENVGAVIRSAVAFGVDQIILLAESAHPYHPKTLRASGGAVLRARLWQGPLLGALPEDLEVVPLSAEGRDIAGFTFPERFALLPGLEGEGVPAIWRRRAVAIPIRPEVESLNAATAAAIALYLWSRGKAAVPAGR